MNAEQLLILLKETDNLRPIFDRAINIYGSTAIYQLYSETLQNWLSHSQYTLRYNDYGAIISRSLGGCMILRLKNSSMSENIFVKKNGGKLLKPQKIQYDENGDIIIFPIPDSVI